MSKLSDALRRATRPEARPIGFGAASATRNPTMLVFARAKDAAAATQAATKGADAVIAAAPDKNGRALWGSEAPVGSRDAARALRESGAHFLIFTDDDTPASVLLEDELGFIMRIGLDASDTFLRSVEGLALDALLVPGLDGELTVRRTLDLRRIASFTRKALVLPVTPEIEPADLEALRECGVIAVVVEGAEAAATLRTTIDALPPRRKPKDGRRPTLLGSRAATPTVSVEEDEDEDED